MRQMRRNYLIVRYQVTANGGTGGVAECIRVVRDRWLLWCTSVPHEEYGNRLATIDTWTRLMSHH